MVSHVVIGEASCGGSLAVWFTDWVGTTPIRAIVDDVGSTVYTSLIVIN